LGVRYQWVQVGSGESVDVMRPLDGDTLLAPLTPGFYELSIIPMLGALLRYLLVLEQGQGAAPEDVFAADRMLQGMGVAWVLVFGLGVYVG
jgi:hypothetical protein